MTRVQRYEVSVICKCLKEVAGESREICHVDKREESKERWK
jgi:hypothetical protein